MFFLSLFMAGWDGAAIDGVAAAGAAHLLPDQLAGIKLHIPASSLTPQASSGKANFPSRHV